MSPKFKFRFDPVLKQREIIEQTEAKIFAELHKIYDDECKRLEEMTRKFQTTQGELTSKEKIGINIKEIKIYYAYLNSLKIDMKTQKLRIMDAEQKMEAQRKKLAEAQKNKKVIDKLKENKYNEFIEEERKSEIKTIDDVNSVKAARNRTT